LGNKIMEFKCNKCKAIHEYKKSDIEKREYPITKKWQKEKPFDYVFNCKSCGEEHHFMPI